MYRIPQRNLTSTPPSDITDNTADEDPITIPIKYRTAKNLWYWKMKLPLIHILFQRIFKISNMVIINMIYMTTTSQWQNLPTILPNLVPISEHLIAMVNKKSSMDI